MGTAWALLLIGTMGSVAVPLKLKPVPVVSDRSIAKLKALDLAWPNMVPSAKTAAVLMFDPAQLPPSLHAPTLKLLKALDDHGASAPPDDIPLDDWVHAQAVVWRLTAADALAQDALRHDEAALQQMFEEAAKVREWLLSLGHVEAMALRALLQQAWSDVLAHAPPAPVEAPQRPPARTGNTRIGPMPTRPEKRSAPKKKSEFDGLDAPLPLGRIALVGLLAAMLAARLFLTEGDLKAPSPVPEPTPQGEEVHVP